MTHGRSSQKELFNRSILILFKIWCTRTEDTSAPTGPKVSLIDIKSEGEATYRAPEEVLRAYKDVDCFYPENTIPGAIAAIISGNRPRAVMENETLRYAAMDGRLEEGHAGKASCMEGATWSGC